MPKKAKKTPQTPPLPVPTTPPIDDLCNICNKLVLDTDPALCCDRCNSWAHNKCNKVTKKQYTLHQNNPDTPFECNKCRKCGTCHKTIAKNHRYIDCSNCKNKIHIKCNKFTDKDLVFYRENPTLFTCSVCLHESLPFLNLDNNQFKLNSNAINYPEDTDTSQIHLSESQQLMLTKFNNAIDEITNNLYNEKDDPADNIQPVDCKYYTLDNFKNLKIKANKNLSILHINITSIQFHIEEFRIILQLLNHKFDFICISESKLKINTEPTVDINIEGYQTPVGMPSHATKGGVLIYIKEGIDYKPRDDLKIHKEKELESYFIEQINPRGKNNIIGTIYRHPCMDGEEFLDEFMKPLNQQLDGENKKIFIAGDFNFDLSKTNHKESANFFEEMMANFLMPVITLPTKINSKRHTIIDNIFTNQINPDMRSGNLSIYIIIS